MAPTPARWQRIEALYHSALERDPAVRAAFLDGACGQDGDLRREVESLLAEAATGQVLLNGPHAVRPAESAVTELKSGARLGPYQIEALIGEGGMGKVYRALDTRLGRTVALKTSAQRFTDRFEREARAIASLNHPNICTLHDVGPNYLVMELVEGPTLAERIQRGPVPLEEALGIARQIADALEAAHEKGIVHRDLKPANVKIRPDGSVKVLDFGLAKAGADSEVASELPTMMSMPGMILGTPGYMSPEQARGEKVGKRADIWAFGVVLYEMVTGERLTDEPDWAKVPARLQRVLRLCLARDSNRRLRDISGVGLLVDGEPATSAPLRPGRVPHLGKLPWVVAGVLAGVVAGWALRPAAGVGHYRFTPMEVSGENPSVGVWSPDGKAFAYSAGAAGQRRVFLRYLNSPAATPLTRAASLWSPVGWSADSKRIFARGMNPQGKIPPSVLFSVPVFGGDPEPIMATDSVMAAVSPDGNTFAFLRKAEDGRWAVYTTSPPGSPLKRYAPAPFEANSISNSPNLRFSPDGRWLTLFQDVPGDKQAWRLPYPPGQDPPRRFLKGLHSYGTPWMSWFPGARTGVLSWTAGEGESAHLWIAGFRSGVGRQITSGGAASGEHAPAISPDGKKILFIQGRDDYMILSASLSDASVERVISSDLETGMPAWASHQEKFAYESDRNGTPAIWMRAEGWDRPIVTEAAFPPGSTAWFMTPALSPGADRVVYRRTDRDQRSADWISSVSGGPPVRLTNATNATEWGGSWSPDGRRFAYTQTFNAALSLMLVKASGEATPAVLRENLGANLIPQWSPDGQWISFFEQPKGSPDGSWKLISPDGITVRGLGEPNARALTFSSDSQRLYGIRAEQDHNFLFSLNIATRQEKIIGDIGKSFTPVSYLGPSVGLSLSPDGKSILFPSYRLSSSLWMLEGFDPPGWALELREMLPW